MPNLRTALFHGLIAWMVCLLPGCGGGSDPSTREAPATKDAGKSGRVEALSDKVVDQHDRWIQNFERAKAIAQTEGKDILMDFTGTDWCGWCIRLSNEVFQYQIFHDYADEHFVLLELDFPNDKSKLTDEIVAQNEKLQLRYGVEEFPTILLLDSAGRPYGKTGYQPGGPATFIEHLAGLQQLRTARDATLKEADGLEGVERAEKIHEALTALDPGMLYPAYAPEMAQIIELDAENEAGLKVPYLQLQQSERFKRRIGKIELRLSAGSDVEAGLAELQNLQREFADYPDGKKQIAMMQMNILGQEERHEEILAIADAMLADESLSEEDRRLYQWIRYSMLRRLKRNDEAIATLDAMIESAGDDGDEQAQLLVDKSEFLVALDRIDEARESFEEAKRVAASSHAQDALQKIEQELFKDVDTLETPGESSSATD